MHGRVVLPYRFGEIDLNELFIKIKKKMCTDGMPAFEISQHIVKYVVKYINIICV